LAEWKECGGKGKGADERHALVQKKPGKTWSREGKKACNKERKSSQPVHFGTQGVEASETYKKKNRELSDGISLIVD